MQHHFDDEIQQRHKIHDRTYAHICNATHGDIALDQMANSSLIYPDFRVAGIEHSSKLQIVLHLLKIYPG
jgi:hypothetical protein